jgi:glycosyltransferase involved in cell wall biosynthesis
MAKFNMRIVFLTKYDRKAASSRYRFMQYIPFLESHGIDCTVSPLFDDYFLSYLYKNGKRRFRDIARGLARRLKAITRIILHRNVVVVIQTEAVPFFPAIPERLLSLIGIPYVLDYDDALFHQYNRHRVGLVRWLLGKKIARIMQGAELVVAGNRYIADYARQVGARWVEIIPTVIDLDRYPSRPAIHPENHLFTIGWIGSPSTSRYLTMIAPALAEVCSNGRGRVVLIGSDKVDLPGVPAEILPWDETTEVNLIQSFDVGIMPLPDEPWERGKCGFKLIQYMACGLPVIASPVGVNVEIVEVGSGFLPVDHAGWVEALNLLRDNSEMKRVMGLRGRQIVEQRYCLQVTAVKLSQLLLDVIAHKKGTL